VTLDQSNSLGRLAATVGALYGDFGVRWLERLPTTVAECEQRWLLTALPPFDDLTYNYIAPVVLGDGSQAILKIGVPGEERNPELASELEALRRFDGRGCVRLLADAPELGAFLLEQALPGTTLAAVADDVAATRIAARVMKGLWRPVEPLHPFPTISRWGRGFARMRARFGGSSGPLPRQLTARAESLFSELLASMEEPVLLHGDLHHWNILRSEREPWLAIDPKGVVGEPAYEVGALLRNMVEPLLADPDPVRVTRRRLDVLSEELDIDRERLGGWGLAQAVLSAWWDIEDGTGTGASAVAMALVLEDAMVG
jgi:streptomycin 6-kinase